MANKYVYLQDFGIIEVPAELQGDALIRYANQEADRIIAASPQRATEAPAEKTSPGILSQTGAFVGSIPEGIAKGVGSTISGIGALTTIDALKRAGAATSEFGEDISKYLMDEELRQSMGAAGGRLVGNIATYLTPGIAAKALGLAPRAALALSSAVSGAAGAGEQLEKIQQARAEGKEISPAQEFGLTALAGAGTAALESLPLGRMLGSPVVEKIPLVGKIFKEAGLDPNLVRQIEQKYAGAGDAAERIAEDLSIAEFNRRANLGLGGIFKSALQSGAIEAPVEGLQNTLQNVISKYAYNPEQEITEGLKESLIAGGLAGSAIQGGIEIYQSKQARTELNRKMAEANRLQTEAPVAPKTASQETLFVDPVTGEMKTVGRETEEQKKIKEIAKGITSGANLPTALPTEKTVSTRIGDISVPASLTPEEIEQQVSEIEALRAYSEESARNSQLAYEQGEKAKKDLADAKNFISQYRSVANEILPEVGVDSIKDLYKTPADVPAFVDLMIDRIYKNQEQLDLANKNIESNLGIASDLSRSVFKANISELKAPQRIELSGLVDRQFEADIAEYESAKEEAGIRTAMNVEGSSKEPVYVRQKRLAVELFGKPYEGLDTSERNEVNAKAKRRAEGLEVSTNEIVEKRQFEGKPFTTVDYRRVLEGLKSDPEKSITTSRIIEDFGIPPSAAPSMVSLMRQRGDAVKVGSKILVDESAKGPMYEITEDTEATTAQAPSGEALFQAAQTSATQPQFDEQLARQYAPDLVDALKKRKMGDLFLLGISNALLDAEGNVQPANGAYLNRVIYLATSPTGKVRTKEEMISTLDHEIIHGMKELGMFSANEWRMLTEKFTPSVYLGDREKVYRERYKGRTNLEDLIKEEAVARAASNLAGADPKRLDPAAKSLVRKVESFLGFGRTAAQMGYASAEDVLSAIKSGEIGGRRFTPIYEAGRGGAEIYAPREIQIKAGQKVPDFTLPAPKVAEPAKVKPTKGGKAKKVKPKSVDEAVYSYIGESAYSDDPIESASIASSKESALGMERDGYSPEKIRLATGWFRGPYDNEWRREVADDLARVTDTFRDMPETTLFGGAKNQIPLSRALNHPELFRAYPDLNSVKVIRQKGFMDFGGLQGWFDSDTNTINITPYAKDPESTLLHEVQHWIQEKEGFATGGNREVAIEMANPDLIESALGRVLEKKKNDIGKIGKEIEDWSVAEKIRGSDEELVEKFKDLSKKSDERFREFAKVKYEDPNRSGLKERWIEVYTERQGAMDSLLSIIRSQFRDASPYSVLAKLSADPSGRQYDERRLVEIQKEIAQIQSGDKDAILEILKASDESFNLYRNIAGEIEARDVQARKPLTARERELEEPFSSEKVERSQLIVIKGKKGKGEQSDIMYSLVDQDDSGTTGATVTPGGIVRAFSPPAKKSIVDSIYDFFSVDRQSSFRQKFLDRYDPIKEWAIKAYEKTQDPKYLAAASGAYQALLFSDKAQDVAMAFLEMGGLSYDGKIFTAKENEKTAPIKIFGRLADMPASQPGFNNKLEEFFEASYARRYLDLVDKQGKDPGGVVNLDDVRRTWDTFSGDTDITDAMADFKAFNDNLIDIFVKSGFIDKGMGESWKQAYYIPFYRLPTKRTADGDMETGEVDAPRVSSKATNLAAYKALSGRNLRVNDAIENVIYNTYFMVGTAMKNVAAQRVVRDGLVTGYMKELKVDPDTKRREREEQGTNVISIRDKGVKKFYQVNDPMVYDAVAKSNIPVQDALKMMGGFTKLLRKGVTLGPGFILRNPIRDTLQVWMQGGFGSNLTPPVGEYIKGITAVLQDSPEYRALRAAGISGSGIRQENIKDTATAIRQKIGVEQKNIVKKFLGVLENASEKSEGISRVQAYKNALEKTGDEAEALFAAMETINFSRRGTSRGAQIAIALLPFFNARLQGLDVFYRTLKGDRMVPKELSPNGRRDAVTRMAYVASLSMLYAALMAGNKAWQNASEEERDANIFIPIDWIEGVKEGTVLKFPIPQELGIFTKMLPERLVSWYLKQEDGTDLVNAMARAMLETLSMDPLPQMIRPMYENVSNFDFYTMKPIENRYLQNLLPEERYTEYTSEAYKKVGQALGVSPVKLDHLIRGYTGTIGALTADAAGMMLELGKENAKPERMRFSEPNLLPAIGQLFRGPNGKRAVEELYQLDEAANMAVATLRAVSKGQREMSPESQEELRSMLYIDKAIAPTLKRVQALNRMKRTILAADDMSPKEKRDELNAIDEEIVSISSELKDLKSELPARFRVGLAKHFGF